MSLTTMAEFKIVAASIVGPRYLYSSIERTARRAAKCQIDLYFSVIIHFSGKESQ